MERSIKKSKQQQQQQKKKKLAGASNIIGVKHITSQYK
jgi:hypothetical protein